MALGNPAVGGSKGDTKTSAKHVVAEMEDSRTGVRFPPPPPIIVLRIPSPKPGATVSCVGLTATSHCVKTKRVFCVFRAEALNSSDHSGMFHRLCSSRPLLGYGLDRRPYPEDIDQSFKIICQNRQTPLSTKLV
jgi:hypothetical protein